MSDEAELLKLRQSLVHGLANSIAVIGGNLEPMRPYAPGGEPLCMLIDMECSVTDARKLFEELRKDLDAPIEERRRIINALATVVAVLDLNLRALERHVHRRDGRNILGDMQVASARASAQFAALRKLL